MKRSILFIFSLLCIIAFSSDLSTVVAQQISSKSRAGRQHTNQYYNNRPVKQSRPQSVNRLPSYKYTISHNGVNYYRNGSKYYKRVNNRYVLTPIPFGVRVPVIPSIHSIFRYNNRSYYSSGGVIYREYGNQYVVVEPRAGMVVPELPMYNVNRVNIDGMLCFEYEGILYKEIPTVSGIQYEVIGNLHN